MTAVGARIGFGVVGLVLLALAAVAATEVLFLAVALAAIGLPFLVVAVQRRWAAPLAAHARQMAAHDGDLRRTTVKVLGFTVAGLVLVLQGGLGWIIGGAMLLGAAGVGGFVVDAWRVRRRPVG